jgi:hypothetical protein
MRKANKLLQTIDDNLFWIVCTVLSVMTVCYGAFFYRAWRDGFFNNM